MAVAPHFVYPMRLAQDQSPPVVDKISDPSFESGITGGDNFTPTGVTNSWSTEQAYTGTHSLKSVLNSVIPESRRSDAGTMTLLPNTTYLVTARVWIPSSYPGSWLLVQDDATFSDATQDYTHYSADLSKRNQWQEIYFTIKTGTVDLVGNPSIVRADPTIVTGNNFYVDEAHIYQQFPLNFGAHIASVEQDSDEDILSCVYVALKTPIGSRPGLPNFGVDDYTFANGQVQLSELQAQILASEPRAELALSEKLDDLVQTVIAGVGNVG